MTFMGNSVL